MVADGKITRDSESLEWSASTEVRKLEVLEGHCCLEGLVGSE